MSRTTGCLQGVSHSVGYPLTLADGVVTIRLAAKRLRRIPGLVLLATKVMSGLGAPAVFSSWPLRL